MIGTRDGVIQKAAQARGMKKALAKMVEHMGSEGRDLTRKMCIRDRIYGADAGIC